MFKKLIWISTILWMAIIFILSHQPAEVSRKISGEVLVKLDTVDRYRVEHNEDVSDGKVNYLQNWIRKWAHFIEYFVLGGLVCLSVVSYKYLKLKSYFFAWIFSTFYAATDEIHQIFVPGRGPSVKDVYLDSFASFCAIIVLFILIELMRKFEVRLLRFIEVPYGGSIK